MDPVKDLTLSKDSEVSGMPASNHKHHSWQWCGWKKKKITLIQQHTFPLMFLQRVHCPEKKVLLLKKENQAWHSQIITIWLSIPSLKNPTAQSQENTTFYSEKLREEASDNDNMKQVWKIMAVWGENISKKFRLALPKMEETFCQR